MKNKLVKISKLTVKKLFDPFYAGAAAEVAFFFLMSLVPATIILAQLLDLFTLSLDAIKEVLESYLSEEILDVILPLLSYKPNTTISILFIVLALWSGSKALFSMMRITNYAHFGSSYFGSSLSGYVKRRIKAIITVIVVLVTIIFALNIIVFGELFIQMGVKYLNDFLGEGISFTSVWYTLRWIIGFALYFFMVSAIYFFLPTQVEDYSKLVTKSKWETVKKVVRAWLKNCKETYRMILPGSIFAAVTMFIATWIYAFYMRNIAFSNFNYLYGGLSSIIVLLLWFYVLSFILIIGIQLNVAIEEYSEEETVVEK